MQLGYSEKFAKYMYDEPSRRQKALRAVRMFEDQGAILGPLKCLEVGSATGIMSYYLADHFGQVIGIDIDVPALNFSKTNYTV